jgi:hypothetical protein
MTGGFPAKIMLGRYDVTPTVPLRSPTVPHEYVTTLGVINRERAVTSRRLILLFPFLPLYTQRKKNISRLLVWYNRRKPSNSRIRRTILFQD